MKVWIYKGEVAGTRAEREAQAAARAGAPGRGASAAARGGDRPSRGTARRPSDPLRTAPTLRAEAAAAAAAEPPRRCRRTGQEG